LPTSQTESVSIINKKMKKRFELMKDDALNDRRGDKYTAAAI